MKPICRQVVAYITRGKELLVFADPRHCEAGLQVPGGGVYDSEDVQAAALREAREQSGLMDIELREYLGACDYDLARWGHNVLERRYHYHLEFRGDAPDTWSHCWTGPGDPTPGPAELWFFWVPLLDCAPKLTAGLGDYVSLLEVPCSGA